MDAIRARELAELAGRDSLRDGADDVASGDGSFHHTFIDTDRNQRRRIGVIHSAAKAAP